MNPLITNDEDSLNLNYASCLSKLKLDLPVKMKQSLLFLKSLALMVRDRQEKLF
jgi:hypothetical protein